MKLPRLLKRGFTMIELLIVIAVLGILAVAVLAAINPIEQINRGRDTGTRSDAEQLLSAIDRYYAGKGYYPWMTNGSSSNTWTDPSQTAAGSGDLVVIDDTFTTTTLGDDNQDMLENLSSGGSAELKSSYVNRIVDPQASNYLYIYNSGDSGDSTYVCFTPKSASFREEAWKRCVVEDGNGGFEDATLPSDYPDNGCPAVNCLDATTADTATACYICLP